MFDKSSSAVLRYQESMLADEARVDAFRMALDEAVEPGSTVLDIGCGSGVLSLLALGAGAGKVIAIESGPIAQVALELFRANGVLDRVELINQMSTDVELGTRADLLVTETIGNLPFDEGILGTVIDARERLLKPGAPIVPKSLTLHAAPAFSGDIETASNVWGTGRWGMDFSSGARFAFANPWWPHAAPVDALSEPGCLGTVDLASVQTRSFQGTAEVIATRSGTVNCIVGWFSSELTPTVPLDNAPGSAAVSWRQCGLALGRAISVASGDRLRVTVDSIMNGAVMSWSLGRWDGATWIDETKSSTFEGELMEPRKVQSMAADAMPVAGPRGDEVRFVLDQMDGQTRLSEIGLALLARFPDRFGSAAEAKGRAQALCQKYGSSRSDQGPAGSDRSGLDGDTGPEVEG